MNIKFSDILANVETNGESLLQTKATLHRAKKKGTLFFFEDISSLTEKETVNLYYLHLCPNKTDDEQKAFPILLENYAPPRNAPEHFQYLKKHYESYYPGEELTHDKYKTFKKTPYIAEKCVWFHS